MRGSIPVRLLIRHRKEERRPLDEGAGIVFKGRSARRAVCVCGRSDVTGARWRDSMYYGGMGYDQTSVRTKVASPVQDVGHPAQVTGSSTRPRGPRRSRASLCPSGRIRSGTLISRSCVPDGFYGYRCPRALCPDGRQRRRLRKTRADTWADIGGLNLSTIHLRRRRRV